MNVLVQDLGKFQAAKASQAQLCWEFVGSCATKRQRALACKAALMFPFLANSVQGDDVPLSLQVVPAKESISLYGSLEVWTA